MPSSYTSSLRFNLQFTGENINLWGDLLNSGVIQLADYAISGWLTKAITGDYSLTTALGATDEARAAMLKFTGSLAVNATITIPASSKSYFVYNATNKVLTFTTGAGATVSVDAGDKTVICCDGAAVHTITFGGYDLKTYIGASVLSATGSLPAVTGNAGKYVYTDGVISMWRTPLSTDLGDYNTKILGVSIAFAVAL